MAYTILSSRRHSDFYGHLELTRLARMMGVCRNAIYNAKEELANRGVLKWKSNGEYWIGNIPLHVEYWDHFIPIPNKLLAHPHLSISAKVVYGGLAYFAGAGGRAYPCVDTLATKLSLSEATVHRGIASLKKANLILITERFKEPSSGHPHRNTSNLYEFYQHELADLFSAVDLLREQVFTWPFQHLVDFMRGDLPFFPPEEVVELFDETLMARIREEITPMNQHDLSKLAPKVSSKLQLLDLPDYDLLGCISPKLWNSIQNLIPQQPGATVTWPYPASA